MRPVDVLQHPLRVVRRDDAEVALHRVVPQPRQVGDVDRTVDEPRLDLEPQHDVEVVGHLVRFDANERRRDHVRGGVELFRLDLAELREELGEDGLEEGPEGEAPTDLVLDHPRL